MTRKIQDEFSHLPRNQAYYQRNKEKVKANWKYHRDNRTQEEAREVYYRQRYGVSYEEVLTMLEGQEYKCPLCSTAIPEIAQYKAVLDHCHTTNKVRGVLCWSCNVALGAVKDSTITLQNMIKYLND